MEYSFTKSANIEKLSAEIQASAIITALDHITSLGDALTVYMKDTLSAGDEAILDQIVTDHVNTPSDNPTEVVTQFEKRDKTLKIAGGEADIDTETGQATIEIQIPGTPGSSDGRWISSGIAFFSQAHPGDKVLGVYFVDVDGIASPPGTVVGSYTDDDVAEVNRGWYVPPLKGEIKAEAIGGYGFAPAGFYIRVIGQKAAGNFTGKFFVNLEWGKVE